MVWFISLQKEHKKRLNHRNKSFHHNHFINSFVLWDRSLLAYVLRYKPSAGGMYRWGCVHSVGHQCQLPCTCRIWWEQRQPQRNIIFTDEMLNNLILYIMESLMISWILPVSQIMLNHLETEKSHLVISEKETLYFYK